MPKPTARDEPLPPGRITLTLVRLFLICLLLADAAFAVWALSQERWLFAQALIPGAIYVVA